MDTRRARRSGSTLTNSAQNTVIPSANSRTGASIPTSSSRGSDSAVPVLSTTRMAAAARSTPAPPPRTLSSTDSLSVSATIPMKPEPSAARTASSICARSARTSSSPATLVHAARSTSSTLPNTNQSRCETGPTIESRSGCTCGVTCAPRHARRRGVALDVVAEVGQHAREVGPRGLGRHAAPEPSDAGEVERGGPRACRVERERQPDLHVARGIAEARRHDPDDRARDVVHHDLPADGAGVAVKALPPDAVRHHHDPLGAGPVFARGEPPAECRANAQDVEEVRRDARAPDADGGLARLRGGEVAVVEPPCGDTVERARLALVEHDHGVGLVHRRAPGAADRVRQPREAVGLRVRERLEQDAVHEAEHGRRGADAEREHEDHRRGEARGTPKAARREPEARTRRAVGGARTSGYLPGSAGCEAGRLCMVRAHLGSPAASRPGAPAAVDPGRPRGLTASGRCAAPAGFYSGSS